MSRIHDVWCEVTSTNYICGCIPRRRAIDADNARIRTELHNRLNQLDDTQLDNLAHELADTAPDAVNDALNEIGA